VRRRPHRLSCSRTDARLLLYRVPKWSMYVSQCTIRNTQQNARNPTAYSIRCTLYSLHYAFTYVWLGLCRILQLHYSPNIPWRVLIRVYKILPYLSQFITNSQYSQIFLSKPYSWLEDLHLCICLCVMWIHAMYV
jgi:hypothetical protein